MRDLPVEPDPNLLVGPETADDAGVYRLTEDLALIQTVDFFTPIVNDPHDFGRIAAANSLSDVYSMGGRPLTALNIVCFPVKDMEKGILRSILRGGLDTIHQAGAVLAGGHSVEDPELKYGLSVTGVVHPERIITNSGARPGDRLVLTKPLGTGILATALKAGMLDEGSTRLIVDLMAALNKEAARAMTEVGVNAATDITGFGLMGHAIEMAQASKVGMRLHAESIPVIPGAADFASIGLVPEGTHKNRQFCSCFVDIVAGVDPLIVDIIADAQTSGGLLISVPEERCDLLVERLVERGTAAHSVVGEVLAEPAGRLLISP